MPRAASADSPWRQKRRRRGPLARPFCHSDSKHRRPASLVSLSLNFSLAFGSLLLVPAFAKTPLTNLFLLRCFLQRRANFLDEDVRAARPRHRTANQKQVFVGVDLDDFQIARGDAGVAHVTRKM